MSLLASIVCVYYPIGLRDASTTKNVAELDKAMAASSNAGCSITLSDKIL